MPYKLAHKAELHLHLEGSIAPEMALHLAEKNGLDFPHHRICEDGYYQWSDFIDFLAAYDDAAAGIKTSDDYYLITYDYLKRSAEAGVLYTEIMPSFESGLEAGLSYEGKIEGIARGIEAAQKDFAITARIYPACVRHMGPDRAIYAATVITQNPHPLVVGFGMGGDENFLSQKDFAPAFKIADEAGLATTTHAGEVCGPESVWDAINHLPVSRIGHGVRSIEDDRLIKELVKREIHLEVCPGSNIALGIYPDFASHPLCALMDAGVSLSLSSDDPPHFQTNIEREYEFAHVEFGLGGEDLLKLTRNAFDAAFCSEEIKVNLHARSNSEEQLDISKK